MSNEKLLVHPIIREILKPEGVGYFEKIGIVPEEFTREAHDAATAVLEVLIDEGQKYLTEKGGLKAVGMNLVLKAPGVIFGYSEERSEEELADTGIISERVSELGSRLLWDMRIDSNYFTKEAYKYAKAVLEVLLDKDEDYLTESGEKKVNVMDFILGAIGNLLEYDEDN